MTAPRRDLPRVLSVASSSPASRSSPPGGLRPTLTPAAGRDRQAASGGPALRVPPDSGNHNFRVSTVSGDCRIAAASTDGRHGDTLAAPVNVTDVHANRMIPLPEPVRADLVDAANTTIGAADNAMSAAACLDSPALPTTTPADRRATGRESEDRQTQRTSPTPHPGYAR
jgi:hypothetical protein